MDHTLALTVTEGDLGAIAATGESASGDESRQILTCVNVDVTEHAVTLSATDSYQLVVKRLRKLEEDPGFACRIPIAAKDLRKMCKDAIKAMKAGRGVPTLELVIFHGERSGVRIELPNGAVELNAFDGESPKYGTIIGPALDKIEEGYSEEREAFATTFNAAFLHRAAKAVGAMYDNVRVEFPADPLSPALVWPEQQIGDVTEAFVLLMPVRSRYARDQLLSSRYYFRRSCLHASRKKAERGYRCTKPLEHDPEHEHSHRSFSPEEERIAQQVIRQRRAERST